MNEGQTGGFADCLPVYLQKEHNRGLIRQKMRKPEKKIV